MSDEFAREQKQGKGKNRKSASEDWQTPPETPGGLFVILIPLLDYTEAVIPFSN